MTDKKFTVKREQWLRGTISGLLLDPSGKMCCLGFCALQLFDCTTEDIQGVGLPNYIDRPPEHYDDWVEVFGSEIRSVAMNYLDEISRINDDMDSSDDEREEKLTSLFHDVGIRIEFED